MSITEIAVLVALGLVLIVNQVRTRPFGLRMLALPVGVAGWLGYDYVYGAPTIANDLRLYLIAGAVGGGIGLLGGGLTAVHRAPGTGTLLVRGSWIYAGLLVVLLGARLAFAWATNNAWRSQVVRFCIDHQITGQTPIVAALMLMIVATILARTALL
ncbi:MAG TPA: hypothetical protein VHB98_18130, partial [Chloroflexota bacterium]|nr:hypothetical protein [Chloroflexota bacterium]